MQGGIFISRDWLGDIIKKDEQKEVKLKGMGKPLSRDVLEGNVLDRTVKNAGYLPEWVALQREVRDRLHKVTPLLDHETLPIKIADEIEAINIIIKKHNKICPTSMQKMPVSIEDFKSHINRWE